jgi:hypothetical protein
MVRDEGIDRDGSKFSRSLQARREQQKNSRRRRDKRAKAGPFATINRLKQKAKGCPAGHIAHAHNIVGLGGVRIELQGRGNAQDQ